MLDAKKYKKIIEHLGKDEKLAPILSLIELPVIAPQSNIYPQLLRSIVGQQLSVKAAETIYTRFEARFGGVFPMPKLLLDTSPEALRAVGISKQKSQYLHNIATTFLEKNWFERDWQQSTNDSIINDLTPIKGVGEWTVQMILMFALNRDDVFPSKDLGIKQAMIGLYKPQATKGKALTLALSEIAKQWQPYRSYACYALWRWKDL